MVMNDDRFDNIPLILETPDESLWEEEIKKLYSLITISRRSLRYTELLIIEDQS